MSYHDLNYKGYFGWSLDGACGVNCNGACSILIVWAGAAWVALSINISISFLLTPPAGAELPLPFDLFLAVWTPNVAKTPVKT